MTEELKEATRIIRQKLANLGGMSGRLADAVALELAEAVISGWNTRTPTATSEELKEAVARIIDPDAFALLDGVFNGRRLPRLFEARDKAAEILSLVTRPPTEGGEEDQGSSSATERGARASTLPLGRAQHSAGFPGPKWIWAESADDFVHQVAGLTHRADEGYEPPEKEEWDEASDSLNALIQRARLIRDQPLRAILGAALSSGSPPVSPSEASAATSVVDAPIPLSSEPGEWRDIESAPKNTWVIVRTHQGRVFKAHLTFGYPTEEEDVCGWSVDDGDPHPDCWSDGVCWANNEDEEPSDGVAAWMSLPPGPDLPSLEGKEVTASLAESAAAGRGALASTSGDEK